jgi:hypothetical protein
MGWRTVLVDRAIHEALLTSSFVDAWEEFGLLVVVVHGNALMPGEAIAYEIFFVCRLYPRRLLVDAVEAADK